jgi:hypothetical protein
MFLRYICQIETGDDLHCRLPIQFPHVPPI